LVISSKHCQMSFGSKSVIFMSYSILKFEYATKLINIHRIAKKLARKMYRFRNKGDT